MIPPVAIRFFMMKYWLFIFIFLFFGCSSSNKTDKELDFHSALGMDYAEFYENLRYEIAADRIHFRKFTPYYINGKDTVFGLTHERFTKSLNSSDKDQQNWTLETRFFNDKLLQVEFSNNDIYNLDTAYDLIRNTFKVLLFPESDSVFKYENGDKLFYLKLMPGTAGVKYHLIDKNLLFIRDSIYNSDSNEIIWNEVGDSWTLDKKYLFKNDLPKERIE